MNGIQQSSFVAVPPDCVWEAIVDFEERLRWSPTVKDAQILEGSPLRERSRICLQVDRQRFTPTVVEKRPLE